MVGMVSCGGDGNPTRDRGFEGDSDHREEFRTDGGDESVPQSYENKEDGHEEYERHGNNPTIPTDPTGSGSLSSLEQDAEYMESDWPSGNTNEGG